MIDLAKLDPNFAQPQADADGIVYRSCLSEPFRVHGLMAPTEECPFFHRMPKAVAESVSEKVGILYRNSAGGRVRFRTNYSRIAVRVKYLEVSRCVHFSLLGTAGLDLYLDGKFKKVFPPSLDLEDGFSAVVELQESGMRDVLIHFPPYSTVESLEIGLDADVQVLPPREYRVTTPVVYYGSSITHGSSATRPGNSYPNVISRRLDCDYLNLGFSASALAEKEIAEYIAGLPMSAFIYDYDHNSPNAEFLRQTHEPMFRRIRERNPELPIVMMSRPRARFNDEEEARRHEVVVETFEKAKAAGDGKVWFVDGAEILNIFGGDCGTVDSIHPNDLGFACIAKALGDVLEQIL